MKKMLFLILLLIPASIALGCTGIILKSVNNDYLAARTMEWGSSFFDSKLVIVPRGYTNQSKLQNNDKGIIWKVLNGFIGIAVGDTAIIAEGMNEKGLSVGVFYFPGFASYQDYSKSSLANGLNVADVSSYILSMYASVDEVKKGIDSLNNQYQFRELMVSPRFIGVFSTDMVNVS
jgi:Penicillin V acylase and related amidases